MRQMLKGLPLAPDGHGCVSIPPWAVAVHATPCFVSALHFGGPATREKRYTYDVLRCISKRVKYDSIKKKWLFSGRRISLDSLADLYFYWFIWPVSSFVTSVRGIFCVVSSLVVLFSNHRPCLERYTFSGPQMESVRRYLKIFATKKKAEFNIGHWSLDWEWRSHLATFSNPLIKVEPLMVFD